MNVDDFVLYTFDKHVAAKFPAYSKCPDDFMLPIYTNSPIRMLTYRHDGNGKSFIDDITAELWPMFSSHSSADKDGVGKRGMLKYLGLTIMAILNNLDHMFAGVNWKSVNSLLKDYNIDSKMRIRKIQCRKLYDYFMWIRTIHNLEYVDCKETLAKLLIGRLFNIFDYMQIQYIYMVFYVIRAEYDWSLKKYHYVYHARNASEEQNYRPSYIATNHKQESIICILDKIETSDDDKIKHEARFILERLCRYGQINNMPQLTDVVHYLSTPNADIKATITSIVLLLD